MNHVRHLGIYQVPIHFQVGLVGAGGIGAMVALVLSKMGVVQLTIWDRDTVSDANIATQLHAVSDVGNFKVIGLQRTLEQFSDEVIVNPFIECVDETTRLPHHYDLFISAVDSITARQDIWSAVTNAQVDWYMDLRMASQQFQMFLVNLHDLAGVARYHAMLMSLSDADIPDEICTQKATFFTASIAAGHAGDALCKILRNEAVPQRVIHYIPQQQIMTFNL